MDIENGKIDGGDDGENAECGVQNAESEETSKEQIAKDEESSELTDEGEDEGSESSGEDGDEDTGSESTGEGEIEDEVSGEIKEREKLIFPIYTKRLPFSLLAALIGAILGLIPATACAFLFGIFFYPLFVAAPLLIFLFNKLFKGGRDIRTLIITAVFSLASAYVTALASQVSIYVSAFGIPVSEIPRITYLLSTTEGAWPPMDSAYIYPLVFVALGLGLAWELLSFERRKEN